ncbi:hypothetical protein [Sphaerisporangium aureirubrum]|uniref:hypothetical protein n=1 Tax=Sphaerisporangium aureirubrum TaxID=1544736 RepID=UPI00363BB2C3
MRLVERLRGDLAGGRNIEIYVTASIAAVVGVLGVFDLVGPKVVGAATLATLGLLAVNALGPRHQVAGLEARVSALTRLVQERIAGEVSADAFLATDKKDLEREIGGADDIRIAGVTLSRTVRTHIGDLQRRLMSGATVRVAIIDPATSTPHEAARRSTIPDDPQIYEHRLKPTIDLLRHLAATPSSTGRLEVRFMPFVPAFGLTLIDPDTEEGRIHVDLYSHRSPGPDPVFTLAARRDRRWYEHFHAEWERLWEVSRPPAPGDGFP